MPDTHTDHTTIAGQIIDTAWDLGPVFFFVIKCTDGKERRIEVTDFPSSFLDAHYSYIPGVTEHSYKKAVGTSFSLEIDKRMVVMDAHE